MRPALAHAPQLALLSEVPGRQRWSVPAIDSRPRLAAAVELALSKEPRVLVARANPVTGKVLVKWHPSGQPPEIGPVLRKALERGPVTVSDYQKLRPSPDGKVRKLIHKLAWVESSCR